MLFAQKGGGESAGLCVLLPGGAALFLTAWSNDNSSKKVPCILERVLRAGGMGCVCKGGHGLQPPQALRGFPQTGCVHLALNREVLEEKSKRFSGVTAAAQQWGATLASLVLRHRDG